MEHVPVLLREAVDGLAVRPGGRYVDGTFGRGGHAREIVRRGGVVLGIDRDEAAVAAAGEMKVVRGNHGELARIVRENGWEEVDGVLLDLGVSSPQLDEAGRGFSFLRDGPLDMRMDRSEGVTAAELVNRESAERLEEIFRAWGEEPRARQVARAIVRARSERGVRFETTLQLVDIIRSAMPPAALREKQHPAKRSFQAIRIAVNGELDALPPMLEAAVSHLNAGGRLAVISFHSLEDRIIKKTMQALASGCTCPPDFPVCVCGKKPKIRLVSRKPIVSGDAELAENPRARSAKLRVAEKL